MPGIGLYRIQAHRTGQYAGISEPEFGPNRTLKVGQEEFLYPEWCTLTVKKIIDGNIIEFTAKEFWIENYAVAKKDTLAPNSMWKKRPFGQLAKCTEAQALRKAFPDIISHQPTFEELKLEISENCTTVEGKVKDKLFAQSPRWAGAVDNIIKGKYTIEKLIQNFDISDEDLELLKSDVLDGAE
jgi:hypothetical protein